MTLKKYNDNYQTILINVETIRMKESSNKEKNFSYFH